MNHTPGPWKVCPADNYNCSCKYVTSKNGPVCEVTRGPWGDKWPSVRLVNNGIDVKAEAYMESAEYGNVPEEEGRANGFLIAAAPEMLEALKACLKRMKDDGYHSDEVEWAEDAIAKAEGTNLE